MTGRIELEWVVSKPATRRMKSAAVPGQDFRILVLSDFSAAAKSTSEPLSSRRLWKVDIDNFERVLASLAPSITLALPGQAASALRIDIASLDDFHPDQLYRKLPVFQAMRELRARLANPATFQQAAAELRAQDQATAGQPGTAPDSVNAEDDAMTLARLLGKAATEPVRPASAAGVDLDRLIRGIVAPHVVPDTAHLQQPMIDSLDAAIAASMRAILHDPAFQALESTWRALDRFVRNVELDEAVVLHVMDVRREELLADLAATSGNAAQTGLAMRLAQASGAAAEPEPWTLIVDLHEVGASVTDLALLAGLGAVAAQAGAVYLASAHPGLLGCGALANLQAPEGWALPTDLRNAWQALRASWVAPHVGLMLPRILMRLPYGERSDRVEGFRFEECVDTPPRHEELLWGSAAMATAELLAKSFRNAAWDMEPGDELEIAELPAYTYKQEGESRMLPCAEVVMSERQAQTILETGIMPVVSYRNRDAARLFRFQSIALPAQALAGAWQG